MKFVQRFDVDSFGNVVACDSGEYVRYSDLSGFEEIEKEYQRLKDIEWRADNTLARCEKLKKERDNAIEDLENIKSDAWSFYNSFNYAFKALDKRLEGHLESLCITNNVVKGGDK